MKLRDYQQRIVNAQNAFLLSNQKRAQVIAPTGAGKTVCFTDMINKAINAGMKNILVVHPRLALSEEQQLRLRDDIQSAVKFTSFHSGGVAETEGTDSSNISTTSISELVEIMNTTKVPHITFTSYKSLEKIADFSFDLVVCDESHYLMQRAFRKNVMMFSGKVVFYTATPVYDENSDISMDNPEYFGNVIENVKPIELINQGFMVPPSIRFADITTSNSDDTHDYAKIIANVFADQAKQIHNSLKHKMLVAMPSTVEFDNIRESLVEIRSIAGDLDVYTITAGESFKNNAVMDNRQKTLDDFKDNKRPSIIIHCDTLAEGIDISGLTGVFMFRGLSVSKFGQTMGRPARPIPGEWELPVEQRTKPNYILTIPVVNGEIATSSDWGKIVEMFTSFGGMEQYISKDQLSGKPLDDDLATIADAAYSKILEVKFSNDLFAYTICAEESL